MSDKVKLRSGAVDFGRIYEQKIAALLSIRCALDRDIADFWMLSNLSDFGAFDDIILFVERTDGSKIAYCIQLKHMENNNLYASQLEDKTTNFYLGKYQDSYSKIKKNFNKIPILQNLEMNDILFFLYTNAPFTKDKSSMEFENKDPLKLLDTTSRSNVVFKISNSKKTKKPLEEDFLQHFFLYTYQASATALDRLIKNEFDSCFEHVSNTVIITITDYFLKWAVGKKGKIKRIFKKDVQMLLLECLLQPYIVEPKQTVERDIHILGLLNDTLTTFNVTPVFRDSSLENIFASANYVLEEICDIQLSLEAWNTNLTDEQNQTLFDNNGLKKQQIVDVLKEKQQFVALMTVKDLYLAAWQCKIVPLVISCNTSKNSVENIISKFENVTKQLCFVLLSSSKTNQLNDVLKVFISFNDLDNIDLMNRNLENTYISLQGKSNIKLKEFKSTEVLQEITPDLYMMLLNGVMKIGEECEIENYYVQRSMKRTCINLDVLDSSNVLQENVPTDLFLLVEYNDKDYIPYQYKTNVLNLPLFLIDLIFKNHVDNDKYIVTTDLPCTDENIMQAVTQIHIKTKMPVHVVKLQDSSLEWIFSKGSIRILQDYVMDSANMEDDIDRSIPESGMLEQFKSETNIISNNAGMGKTFMLQSLANKFDPLKWVCYVNLSEHMPQISRTKDNLNDLINYVSLFSTYNHDEIVKQFCDQICQICWNRGDIVWLLDGYDEVSSEETLSFLRQVKGIPNIQFWITTRPTYKRELETLFDTLSIELTHFSEEDHVMFLCKYFETFHDIYGYDNEQIQYIINTINKCSRALDKTFIAIPLQTRMFAEIFGDDINQITEKENLTIVDLYNKFVDIKLKEYKSYEATSLKKTLSKLALKLLFTEDQLEKILDFEELAEEALTFQESYRKDSIVIGLNENGDAVFGHRTFAEFLAAHWLSKQIVTRRGEYNGQWSPLVEKLFYVDMFPVRLFFDRILSQNLPLHSAVLNCDMVSIQLLLKETVHPQLDKLGRSALHLAVSYGKYYDLYVSSKINGLRSVGLHSVIKEVDNGYRLNVPLVNNQLLIPTDIIEQLVDNGLSNTTDGLFQYDAFDYAMKTCSLGAVNSLYKYFKKDNLMFEAGFNFAIFLYVTVFDNLHNIMSKRKVYDFDLTFSPEDELRDIFKENLNLLTMKYNDLYLTEVAAYTGGKEILFELLQTGKLCVEDGFPVHRACFSGHGDVVELLFKQGASITTKDTRGWDPLYQAGRRGRSDITYQFLRDDKLRSIGLKKITSMTPLHYACQGGHVDCVRKLLDLGVDVITEDAYGYSPLMYATLYGHTDVVVTLLTSISEEKLKDKRVQIVLNIAASKGYSVKPFIDSGLDVNNFDDEGNTPLVLASKNGFSKVIEELALAKNCDLNLITTNENLNSIQRWALLNGHIDFSMKLFPVGKSRTACGGMSALHFAVLHKHADCVKTLIEYGANKNIEDTIVSLGYSPMIWAGIVGHGGILEILLTVKSNHEDVQKEKEDAEMALIWASILGHDICVKLILLIGRYQEWEDERSNRQHERIEAILRHEYGVDYNIAVRPFGEVQSIPLVLAAINGRAKVIEDLTSKKYKNNEDLKTGLYWASRQGHLGCVKALVEAGADPNMKNSRGFMVLPVVWASMYGKTEVVRYFLSHKSQEELKNKEIQLALNKAAIGGHYDCVKMMLDLGFDVNNIDEELAATTPLIANCQYQFSPQVFDELLSRNCDVNVKDSDGLSALDYLARKKKFDFVKKIVTSKNFRVTEVDVSSNLFKDLQMALDWAVDNDDVELIYKLSEMGISKKTDTNTKQSEYKQKHCCRFI